MWCRSLHAALIGVAILAASAAPGLAAVDVSFQYALSNFSGTVKYGQVRISSDLAHDEVYVEDGGVVRVFNGSGMEIYTFGLDPALMAIRDLAVDERGDIVILSYDFTDAVRGPAFFLSRCNYRGEPREKIPVTGLTPPFSRIAPDRLVHHDGKLYLASTGQMLVAVLDRGGAFQKGYDVGRLVGVEDKDRADTEMSGFDVDADGDLLATVPVLFRAFVISPAGEVASFGKPGSAPGMFGVVAGIARDAAGNLYVADKLRSVVLVFDRDFKFIREFGGRGEKPGSLVAPDQVARGVSGKLFVTQGRNRGVSVFTASPD